MELILTINTKRSAKCIEQLLNQAATKIPLQIKKGQAKGTIESKLFKYKAEWELTGEIPNPREYNKPKQTTTQHPP